MVFILFIRNRAQFCILLALISVTIFRVIKFLQTVLILKFKFDYNCLLLDFMVVSNGCIMSVVYLGTGGRASPSPPK